MNFIKTLSLLIFSFTISLGFAQEKRIALIIGNAKYDKGFELESIKKDVEHLSGELEKYNFEIIKGINCSYDSLKLIINQFLDELKNNEVSLVYYSGQAVNYNGKSYIVPINVKSLNEDFESELISFDRLISDIEKAKLTYNFVITETWRQTMFRNRDIGSGVLDINTHKNFCLVYSAVPGSTGQSYCQPGLFVQKFIKSLNNSNYSHIEVLKTTRIEIWKFSNRKQIMYYANGIEKPFYFNHM